jgi:hypothetical protein
MNEIVDLELEKVSQRLKDRKLKIEVTDEAKDFLVEKGYDEKFGARPLRRAVERYLEDTLAEELLSGNLRKNKPIKVILSEDEEKGLCFDQKKSAKEKVSVSDSSKEDGETKKEEKKLAREKMKAEKVKAEKLKAEQEDEEEPEEDEDEAPVGDEEEPEAEPEAEPEDEPLPPTDEEEPEDDGVDPVLVDTVVQKVVGHLEKIMQKVQDKSDAEKFRSGEAKMSGKKEKVNTKPKLEQVRKGRMNFREAIRMSVTGTNLSEGYEEVVLDILEDENIDGPLGYEPVVEKGKLFVEKGSERAAKKALQQSKDINELPKIIGEVLDPEEYLAMEAVEVDGRYKGFKEALKRLTYEQLKQLKAEVQVPEGFNKEDAASFMAAASAAKREGKKKFKFGDKEYPVTIKVDIPLKGEK